MSTPRMDEVSTLNKIDNVENYEKLEKILNKEKINFEIDNETLSFLDKKDQKIADYYIALNKDGNIQGLILSDNFSDEKTYANIPKTIKSENEVKKLAEIFSNKNEKTNKLKF